MTRSCETIRDFRDPQFQSYISLLGRFPASLSHGLMLPDVLHPSRFAILCSIDFLGRIITMYLPPCVPARQSSPQRPRAHAVGTACILARKSGRPHLAHNLQVRDGIHEEQRLKVAAERGGGWVVLRSAGLVRGAGRQVGPGGQLRSGHRPASAASLDSTHAGQA